MIFSLFIFLQVSAANFQVVVNCRVSGPNHFDSPLGFDSVQILDDGENLLGEFKSGTAQYKVVLNHSDLKTGIIYLGVENEKDIELVQTATGWFIRFGDQNSQPEIFTCL